jgi:Signal transduction histidine kinase
VGNAVKFTEQGAVSLYASPTEYGCENVTLEFSVRDTGIGLAPDKLTKLFQPFTQADGVDYAQIWRHRSGTVDLQADC